jgi:hypothetical protein
MKQKTLSEKEQSCVDGYGHSTPKSAKPNKTTKTMAELDWEWIDYFSGVDGME